MITMSDHIYPECPSCGQVPEEGEGVSLSDMKPRGENWAYFEWFCPSCFLTLEGLWHPEKGEPLWWNSRLTLWGALRRNVEKVQGVVRCLN